MGKERLFTQEEVNRIVADRLLREKEKHASVLLDVIGTLGKAAENTLPDFAKMPYDLFESYMTRYMRENHATADEFEAHMKACMAVRGGVK